MFGFVKLMLVPAVGSVKLQLFVVEKCFDKRCSSKVSSQQDTVLLQNGAALPVFVISRGAGVEQSFEFLNVDVLCLAHLVLHQ